MAASAFAFSVMTAAVKLAGRTVPLFELVAIRSFMVAVLSGVAVYRGGLSFRPRQPGRLAQRAAFGFATLSCYFYSIIHLPLADATVIYFTAPVLTALGAALTLGEHMGWREVVLVGVSLLGVVLVARPEFLFGGGSSLEPLAVGIGFAGAAFSAGSWITIRSIRHDPPLLVVFYFAAATVLLATPLMLPRLIEMRPVDVAIIAVAAVATHLGQLWSTWGFRLERAGRASAVGYLQIIFAAGWGWLLFREMPDAWTWVGAGVILAATLRLVRAPRTVQ
jgi:drug/metabolite transporter (DMT)-like permease